jgi:hypothetical protein
MTTTKKRPIHSIRNNALEAAIWPNPTKKGGVFYRVTFSRSYKKADGTFDSADSFGSRNLRDLIALATEAEEWLLAKEAETGTASTEEPADGAAQ